MKELEILAAQAGFRVQDCLQLDDQWPSSLTTRLAKCITPAQQRRRRLRRQPRHSFAS